MFCPLQSNHFVAILPIMMPHMDNRIRQLLSKYGFTHVPFEELRANIKKAGGPADVRVDVPVELLSHAAIVKYPELEAAERTRYEAVGKKAIEAGQVGAVVLNGGMATRFGAGAKGVVEVVNGRSFLDLKISQVAKEGAGRVPVFLMNSFATDVVTGEHLSGKDLGCPIISFSQFISMRLSPEGELFLGADGQPSLHAPGHGDLPYALASSGTLRKFIDGGGRWLTLSNVDNLGASLDPVVIGMHIELGRPMSVELVSTHPGDVGGFPAVVDGRLIILEAFRIPSSFDVSSIPVFNTNTFVFDAASLLHAPKLQWFAVEKSVDGRRVVQFERLVGQLSEHMDVSWLHVPRQGTRSRFIPVKERNDLEARAGEIVGVLREQGVI